jgi:hypothetical protein
MTAVRRKQLQQLGHIRRDPPRLIFGEQLGRRSPARRIYVKGCDMKQTLARIAFLAVVAWTIISFLFLGLVLYLYNFPMH